MCRIDWKRLLISTLYVSLVVGIIIGIGLLIKYWPIGLLILAILIAIFFTYVVLGNPEEYE